MASEHSQKIVAAQPWIGYSATAGAAKTEIPVNRLEEEAYVGETERHLLTRYLRFTKSSVR